MTDISTVREIGPRHAPTPPQGAGAASTLDLLERARGSLLEACRARDVSQRYLQAQLAALRAAAALVAARGAGRTSGRPRSLWDLVAAVAPELGEWAGFFAHSTSQRALIERGETAVSSRDADDLLRQAEMFVELVASTLGMPRQPDQPDHGNLLTPTGWA